MFSMVLLCPPFSSLLSLFFDCTLSGSKYSRVCALYAEKEQQCLAAGVACRYTPLPCSVVSPDFDTNFEGAMLLL